MYWEYESRPTSVEEQLARDGAVGATTMRRLVFIDDDKSELEAFRQIVSGAYD
jgi:hypothetical protein